MRIEKRCFHSPFFTRSQAFGMHISGEGLSSLQTLSALSGTTCFSHLVCPILAIIHAVGFNRDLPSAISHAAEKGVAIYAVGVGEYDLEELMLITGNKSSRIFELAAFSDLESVIVDLQTQVKSSGLMVNVGAQNKKFLIIILNNAHMNTTVILSDAFWL